jgi:DNA-binding CsgD family transcriptional regulator
LTDTLAELYRHAPVQRLLLGGFTQDETARFFAESTGEFSAELAVMLHDQTEGHPLFLAELARDFQQAEGKNSSIAWSNMARRSKGIRGVIGARLNRLPPSSLSVLQSAAVFGREFRVDLLCQSVDGLSEEDCLAAMSEATTACLIAETGEADRFQFVHALVRDTLYDELPATRRTQQHLRIGAALERRYQDDLAPCLSALAHHYHASGPSGDPAKAIEYAIRAARRATEMLAHEEASRHYVRACSALPQGTAADSRRCPLLLSLGDSQNRAGASALALTSFSEAAECARRLGDASLLAHAAVGFSDAQWRLGIEGSQAVALIREALTQASPADARNRTALLTALCRALLFSNQPDEAEAAFFEAVDLARGLDDPLTLFRAMCAILPGRWFPERLPLRVRTAREAIDLAGRVGHPEWVAPYLSGWHTGDLMELGDTAEAKATARIHLLIGETRREPFNEAVALVALSMIAAHEGRFSEAETLAKRALQCGERFDGANAAGIFGVQMFTLWRHQGRLPELMPVFRQFLESGAPGGMWRPGLALLYCELGASDKAREILENLSVGEFSGIEHDAIRIASMAYLAEVCVWLGEKAHAPTLFAILSPYTGRNIVFGAHTASFGAADRLLGMLAALMERLDLAERHLEAAIALDERSGGRPWLARSRFELARTLVRRGIAGDSDRADSLLKAALDDARQLGMRALDESIQDVLRQTAKNPVPGPCVAGLSQREVQVLKLMAAGKTNQQIATEIFRSPNTVANHVRNILGKTRAANRAEASVFAIRHGLASTD